MKLYLKYEWDDQAKAFTVSKGESQHKLELSKDSRKVIRDIVDDISKNSGIQSKFNMIFCLVFWILLIIFYIIFAVILSVKPNALAVSVFSPDVALNSTNTTSTTTTTDQTTNTTLTGQTGYYTYSRVDVSSFGANNGFGIFLVAVVPFILFSLLAFTFVRKTRQQLVREHVTKHDAEYQKKLSGYNMAMGCYFFEVEDGDDGGEDGSEGGQKGKKGGKTQQQKGRGCLAGKLMVGALEFFDKGSEKDRKVKEKKDLLKKAEKEGVDKSQSGGTRDETQKGKQINVDQVAVEIVTKAQGTTFSNWEKSDFSPDALPVLPSTMRSDTTSKLQVQTQAPQPVVAPSLPMYGYQEFSDYPLESARSQYPLLTGANHFQVPAYSSTTQPVRMSQSTSTSIRKR